MEVQNMGKMSELSQVLDELVDCGNRMIDTAEKLRDLFTDTGKEENVATEDTKKAPTNTDKKPAPAEAVNKEAKKIELSDVRKVLAEKARLGFTEEVRALIEKHGAEKLSSVDPKEYADLLKEAEGIGHA